MNSAIQNCLSTSEWDKTQHVDLWMEWNEMKVTMRPDVWVNKIVSETFFNRILSFHRSYFVIFCAYFSEEFSR